MPATNLFKHIAAGVAGGIVGTLAMDYYWKAVTALEGNDPRSLTAENAPDTLDDVSAVGKQRKDGEGSTAAVGRKVHEALTGEEPSSEKKTDLSNAVHWAYGSAMGGAYGTVRDPVRGADLLGGATFGTALWAVGDELMVPVLGLSKGPTAFPKKQHVHRFGAHLAYGCATAVTTQTLLHQGSRSFLIKWGWRAAKLHTRWKTLQTVGKSAWAIFQRWR